MTQALYLGCQSPVSVLASPLWPVALCLLVCPVEVWQGPGGGEGAGGTGVLPLIRSSEARPSTSLWAQLPSIPRELKTGSSPSRP